MGGRREEYNKIKIKIDLRLRPPHTLYVVEQYKETRRSSPTPLVWGGGAREITYNHPHQGNRKKGERWKGEGNKYND